MQAIQDPHYFSSTQYFHNNSEIVSLDRLEIKVHTVYTISIYLFIYLYNI